MNLRFENFSIQRIPRVLCEFIRNEYALKDKRANKMDKRFNKRV